MLQDILRFFIDNIEPDDWETTAMNWLIVAIVVAVLCAGLTFGYKAARKATAAHSDQKIWSRRQTWLSFFIGLFPVFFTLLIIWYMQRDFFNYIQVGGLLKGTLFAWILYLFVMVVGHLVSPWRRELI
jgi:H+/Cl- antiporter ClcA